MKRFIHTWLLMFFLVIFISCQQSESEIGAEQAEMTQRMKSDSVQSADVWSIYNFAQRQGKLLYDHYCEKCHGKHGEADGFNTYTLDPRPHNLADSSYMALLTDRALNQIISLGGRGVNRSVLMPGYASTLSKEEISYLVQYIRTFTKKNRTSE